MEEMGGWGCERSMREPEPGADYVEVRGLGLVFVFGAFVFGILTPPSLGAFGLMIRRSRSSPAPCKNQRKRRASLSSPANRNGRSLGHPEQRWVNHSRGGGDGGTAHSEGG